MDAQEALARRSEIVTILVVCDMNNLFLFGFACLNTSILVFFVDWKEQRNCKNRERKKWLKNRSNRKWLQVIYVC